MYRCERCERERWLAGGVCHSLQGQKKKSGCEALGRGGGKTGCRTFGKPCRLLRKPTCAKEEESDSLYKVLAGLLAAHAR